ncbi:nuclease-related domain-containing protein [Xanthomonas populi]|uniref:nuclease-related domain-containing protein n=1 Tax=Xanthomonas populi TaxID=53414 RepID=UPI001FC9D5FD|nr:nuclease-related domain-containing protein [Xanthomonas populi]
MTPGERRFSQRLEDKLDDEYICWYDVPIGPSHRHPDFIVLHPYRGILVLEVKDWKLETIAEIDRDTAVLHTERGR